MPMMLDAIHEPFVPTYSCYTAGWLTACELVSLTPAEEIDEMLSGLNFRISEDMWDEGFVSALAALIPLD